MSRSSRLSPLFALLLALSWLPACMVTDDVHPARPFGSEEDDIEPSTAGTITGQVITGAGAGLPFAEVLVGEERRFADATGNFMLENVPADVTFLTFRKDDRTATSYRTVDVVLGGAVHYPDVALLGLTLAGAVQSAEGGDVTLGEDGTGATFPPDAFRSDSGPFDGRAGAFMAATRPGDPLFMSAFPGAMHGVTSDGAEVYFTSQGAVWINVIGSGNLLALAPPATATLRLGLPAEQAATAPATILAWQIDPATGLWEEIGESTLDDGVYAIEVARLSPVCWSAPLAETCTVSGTVVDQDGNPLTGARIFARGLGGGFRADDLTDDDGVFTVARAADVSTAILPMAGNVLGAPDTVAAGAPCTAMLDGPLTVALPDFRIALTWNGPDVDLDSYLYIDDDHRIDYTNLGTLERAPYTELDGDDRTGETGETIHGRRWYQGRTRYWVHDYEHRSSEQALATGAMVELTVGDSTWTFDVADVPFPYEIAEGDTTVADSTGWWHVFDIEVSGLDVEVVPVQAFEPMPLAPRGPGGK